MVIHACGSGAGWRQVISGVHWTAAVWLPGEILCSVRYPVSKIPGDTTEGDRLRLSSGFYISAMCVHTHTEHGRVRICTGLYPPTHYRDLMTPLFQALPLHIHGNSHPGFSSKETVTGKDLELQVRGEVSHNCLVGAELF